MNNMEQIGIDVRRMKAELNTIKNCKHCSERLEEIHCSDRLEKIGNLLHWLSVLSGAERWNG